MRSKLWLCFSLLLFCSVLARAQTCTITISVSPSDPVVNQAITFTTTVSPVSAAGGSLGLQVTMEGGSYRQYPSSTYQGNGVYTAVAQPLSAGNYFVGFVSFSAPQCKDFSAPVTAFSVANPEGAFKGSYAFGVQGELNSSGQANGQAAIVGSFAADGKGNITAGSVDLNSSAGSFSYLPVTGTYTLGTNGAGTVTLNSSQGSISFAVYAPAAQTATAVTTAQLVESDGRFAATSGTLMLQTPADFAEAAIAGSYALDETSGAPEPLHLAGELQLSTAGAVNLNYTLAGAGLGATTSAATGMLTTPDAATGRFELSLAGSATSPEETMVGYAVDGSHLYLLTLASPTIGTVLSGTASK